MSDIFGAVEKVLFNRKEHKVGAKYAKVRAYISVLCDLCVEPLRPLRLIDFDFFNSSKLFYTVSHLSLKLRLTAMGYRVN